MVGWEGAQSRLVRRFSVIQLHSAFVWMSTYSSTRQFCLRKTKKKQLKIHHEGTNSRRWSQRFLACPLEKWRVARGLSFIFCISVIFDDRGKIFSSLANFWRCVKAKGKKKIEENPEKDWNGKGEKQIRTLFFIHA